MNRIEKKKSGFESNRNIFNSFSQLRKEWKRRLEVRRLDILHGGSELEQFTGNSCRHAPVPISKSMGWFLADDLIVRKQFWRCRVHRYRSSLDCRPWSSCSWSLRCLPLKRCIELATATQEQPKVFATSVWVALTCMVSMARSRCSAVRRDMYVYGVVFENWMTFIPVHLWLKSHNKVLAVFNKIAWHVRTPYSVCNSSGNVFHHDFGFCRYQLQHKLVSKRNDTTRL